MNISKGKEKVAILNGTNFLNESSLKYAIVTPHVPLATLINFWILKNDYPIKKFFICRQIIFSSAKFKNDINKF
ncbi:hypothetical protein BpHYR1_050774 [Brachionus plicatilis]|uniref:Uncharacterized protein n=1 Tax=Brachionus plicatilis TaxID=10195 RepID=A0A3M7P9H1_BRAPC|nr:hypothetical protein BpHYR1_050774 [Brachionus plicatilis]